MFDDVVITKKIRSFPNQRAWMNWVMRARAKRARPKKNLPFGQMTRKHASPQEQDWKLESRRQRGVISRDWRRTSTQTALKICGRRFKMLQATKAGVPPSCVRPHCRMSWTHFMLTLISSPNTQLWSLLHPQRTSHCQSPPRDVRCEKNPAESEYK